jgi:PrtD family type I secretion system ABC transporter
MLRRSRVSSVPVFRLALQQARGALLAVVLASIIANLLMLTGPLFMLQVYDRVLPSRSVPTLVTLFCLVAALYAFYVVIEILRSRVMARVAAAVDLKLAAGVFRHEIDSRQNGDGSSLLRTSDSFRGFIAGPGPLAVLDLPWTPLYLILVFLLHPALGAVALAGLVVVVVLAAANEAALRGTANDLTNNHAERDNWLREATRNTDALLAMGIVEHARSRWLRLSERSNTLQQRSSDKAGIFTYSTRGFRLMLQSAVLAVGAALVLDAQVSPGVMIASSVITARALAPIEQIAGQWRSFTQVRPAARSLSAALPARSQEPGTILPLPHRGLQVKHLVIQPPGGNAPVVAGVEFALERGAVMAVIGPSGAGKTALVRALTGVWKPTAGSVRLDGASLDQYVPNQRRAIVGYLPQQLDLIAGTVADNISGFDATASSEAIVAAAEEAGAHEFIVSLPNGYETRLTEGGNNLSAGQRQRLGLARALFGAPFFVVLDEPNSHLDQTGEVALRRAVSSCRSRGAIVVLVAHRPAILKSVDFVLHLERGRQVNFGPRTNELEQGVVDRSRVSA